MNLNQDFDVIVIGSGISGGWAAKEFCEKGFKTLVIERGRMVKHVEDYPTANMDLWEFEHRNAKSLATMQANPIVGKHYAFSEATSHFYLHSGEQDYIQEKPFDWIRGYQVGGKSLLWARQTQRWSDYEFESPKRFDYSIDWPIRYKDVEKWYGHVERFIGVSGTRDGIANMPDSEVVGAFEMNAVEKHIADSIRQNFSGRHAIIGRTANLSHLKDEQRKQGRGQCMARALCERGCPFGAYFSSNASTLPYAEKTGNLTIVTDAVVEQIIYDEAKGKASAVQVVHTKDKSKTVYTARVIFVNASTLNSNLILLNSKSESFPQGLGNKNGLMGRYITFHNYRGRIAARMPGFEDKYYYGRRPTQIFMPAFKNIDSTADNFVGTYLIAFGASRQSWTKDTGSLTVGADYKDMLLEAGEWRISMMMQGEVLPRYENHVRLSESAVDKYGIPQLITSIDYDENDVRMMEDFFQEGSAMLNKAGCVDIQTIDQHEIFGRQPGLEVHEMGGVRMGSDPNSSLLNAHNQLHHCQNVFVTDGACMVTTGNQNPSLTFMALTARAANYAAQQMKDGIL